MRNLFIFLCLLLPFCSFSQTEATLLHNWDDPLIPGSFAYDNAYNEVWGFVANDREIAVIGSTLGTHFFDVTDPNDVIELKDAFVAGAVSGGTIIHRDYHDYQCYLYAVADEGSSSTLQIIDISNMPFSNEVVYDDNVLFNRSHNIFIDTATAKMYSCATKTSTDYFQLQVYSLADPLDPALLASYGNIGPVAIPTIHDIYVRNDIAYMNGSYSGLLVADFSNMASPQIIGTLGIYPSQGYNHSGWLSEDGQYYFLADETHGTDIKVLDVSDPSDIQVVSQFNAGSTNANSIPHNLIVRGNYLYTSYYYDGLQVFDFTDPSNVTRSHYYDTYLDPTIDSYEGAWGVYPLLPSGNILVSDMQSGLYVFDKIDASITGGLDPLGSNTNCTNINVSNEEIEASKLSLNVFPNPFQEQLQIEFNANESSTIQIELLNVTGQRLIPLVEKEIPMGNYQLRLENSKDLSPGIYFINIWNGTDHFVRKVIKH